MAQRFTIVESDPQTGVLTIEILVGKAKAARRFGVSAVGCSSQDEILERCQHTADEAAANLQEAAVDASLLEGLAGA